MRIDGGSARRGTSSIVSESRVIPDVPRYFTTVCIRQTLWWLGVSAILAEVWLISMEVLDLLERSVG